ncbi:hypothetical protein Tco_0037737 [Tanacetum coccineum]
MEDHTSDWIRVVPISGLGQTMNGRTYRCVLCYRLGVPLFYVPKPCSACSRVFVGDIYGDHNVSCAGVVGIKHRHNSVRDTLVNICFRSGISSGKEVNIGLGGGRDKPLRPADKLLYSWDGDLDVCVDLTVSSPLTQTRMVDFVSGRAAIDAAQRKRVKYETKCMDIGYVLPFLFSYFCELEKDAVTLLKRIRKFSVSQDIEARAAVHIYTGKKVDIGLGEGRDKSLHRADMLLYSWDGGLDVCVDVTGSSPLTQTWTIDFVRGRAVIEAAQRKRVKYEAKYVNTVYGFLLFSFSSFGELEKDAVTLLKRIRKFSVTQDIETRGAVYIFSRINFGIVRGVFFYFLFQSRAQLALGSLRGIFMETMCVSCAGIIGIKHQRNVVRDILVDIYFRLKISDGKEVDIRLRSEHDKPLRPTNMLPYSWDRGS